MRSGFGAILLALLVASAACSETTAPERHSLLGRWRSEAVAGATIEMVIAEAARSVSGSGRWVAGDTAVAFGVSGTNTGESVSLLLEFGTSPMVNFLGEFVDEDTLEGTLVGAGMGSQPARFLKRSGDG